MTDDNHLKSGNMSDKGGELTYQVYESSEEALGDATNSFNEILRGLIDITKFNVINKTSKGCNQ
jgi:hypothetical protein